MYPLVVATIVAAAACGSSGSATDEDDSSVAVPSSVGDTGDQSDDTTSDDAAPDDTGSDDSGSDGTTPDTGTDEGSGGGADDPNVQLAIDDLVMHAAIDADEITVVANERVTWRDGSLGCPAEGRSYTQALVDGYRIVLSVGSTVYAYHGSVGNPPFRCDDPQDPAEGSRGDT